MLLHQIRRYTFTHQMYSCNPTVRTITNKQNFVLVH